MTAMANGISKVDMYFGYPITILDIWNDYFGYPK